jgi:hypothetical protein
VHGETHILTNWIYAPEDIFEKEFELSQPNHTIRVGKGTFEVVVTGNLSRDDRAIRDEIERELRALLAGAQIGADSPVTLELKSFARTASDGRRGRGVTIFAETAMMRVTMGTPDIIIKDKDGNVVSDTKAERIVAKQTRGQRILRHRSDATLSAIIASYQASLDDRANALVHLYEIRDALKSKFRNEKSAIATLGIGSAWKYIGKLADNEAIREGRHRGTFSAAGLRAATADELSNAREAAAALIEAYLDYLDGNAAVSAVP